MILKTLCEMLDMPTINNKTCGRWLKYIQTILGLNIKLPRKIKKYLKKETIKTKQINKLRKILLKHFYKKLKGYDK